MSSCLNIQLFKYTGKAEMYIFTLFVSLCGWRPP